MANSVDLGAHLESFVAELVKSGRYNSKSEVLREGVRLVEEREKRLAALDAAIARGLADVKAGRVHSVTEVFDRLQARYEGKRTAKSG
jgi:antitoxin ParD1/3/4